MSVDVSPRLGAATPGDDGRFGSGGRGRAADDDGRFAECLDRLEGAVSDLVQAGVSGVSGKALVDGAAALAKVISRLGAVRGNMLVAIEEEESWRVSGVRTFAQWNEKSSGQSPAAAMKEIKRAQALGTDLQHLSAALKNGEVFAEHVDIVRRVFSTPVLKGKLNEGVEGEFVAWARECAPRQFERRVKARAFQEDPASGVENEKAEARKENVAFAKAGSGVRVTGWLSDESSTLLDTALSAVMGRKSADDSRTLPQRRAGALVELVSAKLEAGSAGTGSGVQTHLSVHVPLATLVGVEKSLGFPVVADDAEGATAREAAARKGATLKAAARKAQSGSPVGNLGDVGPCGSAGRGRERSKAGLSGERRKSGSGCGRVGVPSRRACRETGSGQGRFGQCLDAVAEREKDVGKVLGRIPALLNVDAFSGLEPAVLDDGSPLSASQLARLLCDSTLSRVILTASGEVLDVGRNKRLFTSAQRRAVIARDRTCRYPGCNDTIAHGQIHHALPWQAAGRTTLANAVLLCWHHHAMVHREAIAISHHDGGFVFTSPDGTAIGIRRHGT